MRQSQIPGEIDAIFIFLCADLAKHLNCRINVFRWLTKKQGLCSEIIQAFAHGFHVFLIQLGEDIAEHGCALKFRQLIRHSSEALREDVAASFPAAPYTADALRKPIGSSESDQPGFCSDQTSLLHPISRNKMPAESFDLPNRILCFLRLPVAQMNEG